MSEPNDSFIYVSTDEKQLCVYCVRTHSQHDRLSTLKAQHALKDRAS